jgi:hypothetical protein
MKLMGCEQNQQQKIARPRITRVSDLNDENDHEYQRRISPFGKLQKEDSVMCSKVDLSTQETFINEAQRTQTNELLTAIGLSCFVKSSETSKPCHRRTGTDISDIPQFENVDEETENANLIKSQISHVKKSLLPTVIDDNNEYGGILKIRK